VSDTIISPRAHVFIRPSSNPSVTREFQLSASRALASTQNPVGTTAHFVVYSDGSADGNASAQAILQSCEADFAAIAGFFGGISLPPGQEGDDQTNPRTATPLHVLMDPNAGGAYHYGCNATDLYVQPVPDQAEGLMVAELVEVFEAAQNKGWACGQTNGEALSRVLAIQQAPSLASVQTDPAQSWWSNGHADYVTNNDATDQNQDSNGCGPLFLYYLHSQLNFSWAQIVAAAGGSLGACYQTLTGKDPAQGFQDFLSRLTTIAQNGQLNLPANGNPFPIGATEQPAPSSAPASGDGNIPLPDVSGAAGGIPWLIVGIIVILVIVGLGIVLMTTGALPHP